MDMILNAFHSILPYYPYLAITSICVGVPVLMLACGLLNRVSNVVTFAAAGYMSAIGLAIGQVYVGGEALTFWPLWVASLLVAGLAAGFLHAAYRLVSGNMATMAAGALMLWGCGLTPALAHVVEVAFVLAAGGAFAYALVLLREERMIDYAREVLSRRENQPAPPPRGFGPKLVKKG